MSKKILSGMVINDKNDKTIIVLVKRKYSFDRPQADCKGNDQGHVWK